MTGFTSTEQSTGLVNCFESDLEKRQRNKRYFLSKATKNYFKKIQAQK